MDQTLEISRRKLLKASSGCADRFLCPRASPACGICGGETRDEAARSK